MKRGIAISAIVAIALGLWSVQRESARETETASGSETERASPRESETTLETERDVEIAHDDEVQAARPLVEHLTEIRDDVHVLEMQRFDARARHDVETEARLDAEIANLRAQNDRLRGVTEPEGI